MGLLNRYFGSSESIAEEIVIDDDCIKKAWNDYIGTVDKKDINDLINFKRLLELELVDIYDEKKEEDELIADLEVLEHSQRIDRVHELERTLNNVVTKHEYVYELLKELYSVLKFQMHIVNKLSSNSENIEKLNDSLRLQLSLEHELIEKIKKIETFHNLFASLVKGEHIIHVLSKKEKRMIHYLYQDVKIGGMIDKWVMRIFDMLYDKIHEYAVQGVLEQNENADIHFVNSILFEDLVRNTIKELKRKGNISKQMIHAFVHVFREKYCQIRG